MSLTRFAPAPTGYLHLGHVANAIYVWGLAATRGAGVALRIEDHDRQRCRFEFELALLDDLEWLGFLPDEGCLATFRDGASAYRQSDNEQAYQDALAALRERHQVYACDCSRRDLVGNRPPGSGETTGGADEGATTGEIPYSGRCRERGLAETPGRGLRVVVEPGEESFTDLLLGPQVQTPSRQCGDMLLRDRLGNWTYQFAVVVDDLRHGVDLIIRGEDLLASTGRQLRLARMLGRVHPVHFVHHPLIRKPSGEKLSKAGRDTSVRDLRIGHALSSHLPCRPEEIIGRAAHVVGLVKAVTSLPAAQVGELFRGVVLSPGESN